MGLRDTIKKISPTSLQGGTAEKLLYSMGLVGDVLLEKVNEGVLARIPTRTKTVTSLPFIGADREIPQGLSESSPSYAIRLKRAFDDWYYAGSARSILSQILGYLSSATPRVLAVNNTSAWDYIPQDSTSLIPTHLPSTFGVAPTANWDWDSALGYTSAMWWRTWIIIDSTGWVASTRTWTDGVKPWGDPGYSWGLDCSSSVISSIRSLVGQWKSQHAWVRWLIICFDPTEFDPTTAPGDPSLPDGTWGYWSKIVGGTRVAARSSNARYCDGVI
jgi:hypothetical protein